jgi:O-antigen ligase
MLLTVVSVAYHYVNNSFYANTRLSGINAFRNPNEMGALSGIISLLSFSRALISTSSRVAILFYTCSLISAVALIMSFSRGAVLALSVSLILSLLVFRPKAKTYIWVFIIFVTITIFILAKFNSEASMLRGNLENLGGRLPIWKEVIERTKSHVFFGIGLSKDSSIIMGNTFFNHAHNAWLDTFFRTGLAGLILIALHLFEVFRRCSSDPFVLISAVWLTYGCIFNIFDGQIFFEELGAKWFFYWIPAAILVGLSYKNTNLGKVKNGF